jgi:hypothetical protein
MEQKFIQEFLDANQCEEFLRVLEIILQCREMERRLAAQQSKNQQTDQISNAKTHMTLLVHAQLCRIQQDVSNILVFIYIYETLFSSQKQNAMSAIVSQCGTSWSMRFTVKRKDALSSIAGRLVGSQNIMKYARTGRVRFAIMLAKPTAMVKIALGLFLIDFQVHTIVPAVPLIAASLLGKLELSVNYSYS